MNQDDIERRLQEIFGAKAGTASHTQGTKEIDNPAFVPPGSPGFNPTIPPKISVTEESWKDAGNKNGLTIQRWPDGTIHEIGATTAPAGSTASPDESVSAPSNQPNIATRQPDGTIKWVPNQNYQPPQPTPRTPEQQATEAAAAQTATAENNERQWNSQHGYGWVTHAQRQTQIQQEATQARADQNVARQTAATEAANQLARDRLQFDKDKANLPDVKPETVKGSDGKLYTRVVTTTPQGAATIKNYGPDNKEVSEIPGEGPSRPTVAGPSMPQIVLGASQDAAAKYKGDLQQGVASGKWSQSWANDRWKEFMEVANLAVSEAATQQRERESTRAADINLASSRATLGQNAITEAAGVVDKINGLLPEGSPLGGQAFAAMLGISMLMQARSGIDSIDTGGRRGQQPAIPTLTPGDLADRASLEANRQWVNRELANTTQQQAAPPVTPAAPPAIPGTPSVVGDTGAPAVPAMATPSAPRPAPAPVSPASPAPAIATTAVPPPVTAADAARYEAGGINPATGDAIAPLPGPLPGLLPAGAATPPAQLSPWTAPSTDTSAPPDYGQPGMRLLPTPPSETVAPLPPNEVSMAPYPVLAAYQPPPTGAPSMPTPGPAPSYPVLDAYQPQSVTGQTGAPSQSQYPAALHSRAASTPFWQMSPEEVAQYEAAGIPPEVIEGPGRRMVA